MYHLQAKEKKAKNAEWETIKDCLREYEIGGYYAVSKKETGHFWNYRVIDDNGNVILTTEKTK